MISSLHPVARAAALAQGVDGIEGLDDRVQGVDAVLGGSRGMGALAEELEAAGIDGVHGAAGRMASFGVGHHGHVQIVIAALCSQNYLAAGGLLRRGADDPHFTAILVHGILFYSQLTFLSLILCNFIAVQGKKSNPIPKKGKAIKSGFR